MQVLIVDDDRAVARLLQRLVSQIGYQAHSVASGEEALQMAQGDCFDLILLDVRMPDIDGLEVCRRLRSQSIDIPVMMLSALDSPQDRINGLESGADDYLCKPFHCGELLARTRALLRRGTSRQPTLRVGDLHLDPATRRVTCGGPPIPLTTREFALLEYLMRNPNRVLPRTLIVERVWGLEYEGSDQVLEVYISYLRKKIPPQYIRTVRGSGYTLCQTGSDEQPQTA